MPRIKENLTKLKKRLILDSATKRFIKHNKEKWLPNKKSGDSVILVDFFSVAETIISFSYFTNALAKIHNADIKSFSEKEKVKNLSLHKVYNSFNTSEHLYTILSESQKKNVEKLYNEIKPNLKTKNDLFNLIVLDIWIGVDIYETYLNIFHKPTVDLESPQLIELIKRGIGLIIFWKDYFKNIKVAAVVVSHDLYLTYNVVCKVAYIEKVPVYLPNVRGIWHLTKEFTGYLYFKSFRKMFQKLSKEEQAKGITLAKNQLERRFSGEVGVNMEYSTKSAFQPTDKNKKILKVSDRPKILICSNCFYDNPQAYGTLLFPDFYEWLCFLGEYSKNTEYDWYLKMHPDPMPGTVEDMHEILSKYPHINFLPFDTSHLQLISEGIDVVLTAYGSVGHEYPLAGVQVINAGYNPHIAYEFNWHPKTIDEYKSLLGKIGSLKSKILKEDIYEFYYMYNYYTLADSLVFKSYTETVNTLDAYARTEPGMYDYFLNELTESKHKEILSNMTDFIQSKKSHYFSCGPEETVTP